MQEQTFTVAGCVKWFNPKKGFGFVVPDDGGDDILLHANVLQNFGQRSVAEQLPISLNVQVTERGLQAVEVLELGQPKQITNPTLPERFEGHSHYSDEVPWVPVRVKWFNEVKGFGFANVFDDEADVFIHAATLQNSGLATLEPGEAIRARVFDGERGLVATEISQWKLGLPK